jgi:MoxR-like ATPase
VAADLDPVELEFRRLAADVGPVRERLDRLRRSLHSFAGGRRALVDLLLAGAIAREPVLLVGPPGNGQAVLVERLADALGVARSERVSTVIARETDRTGGRTREGWAQVRVAFLDQLFCARPHLVDELVSTIDEYRADASGPAKLVVAATIDCTDDPDHDALLERFCVRVPVQPLALADLVGTLDAEVPAQAAVALGQRPWAQGHATLDDLTVAARWLALALARTETATDGTRTGDRDRYFDAGLLADMRRVLVTLEREAGVVVGDERVVRLYRILRAHAFLVRGGRVEREDLALLAIVGRDAAELALLADEVPHLLGLA